MQMSDSLGPFLKFLPTWNPPEELRKEEKQAIDEQKWFSEQIGGLIGRKALTRHEERVYLRIKWNGSLRLGPKNGFFPSCSEETEKAAVGDDTTAFRWE